MTGKYTKLSPVHIQAPREGILPRGTEHDMSGENNHKIPAHLSLQPLRITTPIHRRKTKLSQNSLSFKKINYYCVCECVHRVMWVGGQSMCKSQRTTFRSYHRTWPGPEREQKQQRKVKMAEAPGALPSPPVGMRALAPANNCTSL